ncbi:MAG: hypothetical protein ACI97A_002038 [Planctomycetota bacterium]|jgi:hypothetical protein
MQLDGRMLCCWGETETKGFVDLAFCSDHRHDEIRIQSTTSIACYSWADHSFSKRISNMNSARRWPRPSLLILSLMILGVGANFALAQRQNGVEVPDLTRGGIVPQGWTHDWNLGPTGARGWIFSDKLVTTDARQILVTKVERGSPADGVLHVGDVIVGVAGKKFDDDARILFAKAITEAEGKGKRSRLRLSCWRRGRNRTAVLKLRSLGEYAATAPYQCAKSKRIFDQGCKALAKQMRAKPEQGHEITRALNALALLASGNKKYLPLVREQVELLSKFHKKSGVRTWHYAYINVLLAEYVLATGDRSPLRKGLRRITQLIVDGQSAVGSWGHDFVSVGSKRLHGYGMMNSPGIPLTYSLALAKKAGVKVAGLDEAILKSKNLLRFYVDKGSVPYGDHRPYNETHCDNGKNEMAAVLFDFEGDAKATEFFSRMAVASHGAERDTGHTGNFFNMTWALLGVARSGPQATGAWLEEFSWSYDLARRWDGTFQYQGAPTPHPESYDRWDCTGAYLLSYALPLRKLHLTGLEPSKAPVLDRDAANNLIDDGRGWSNKNRKSFYESLSVAEIMERLKSWSPIVRERAAMALGKRKDKVAKRLIKLLSAQNIYARYGACRALQFQKKKGEPAIARLRKVFRESKDLWLRIHAAEALAGIGKPARVAVPDLLTKLTKKNSKDDPRDMERRYLTLALFNQRGGLVGRSLEGVDRDLLVKAVRASLLNEDGRARGSVASVYKNLTFKQLGPLLPAIYEAIIVPAPSGIMFADGIRTAGLELLAKHQVGEGIELLVAYARNQKKHGSQKRIIRIMAMLEGYGAHAKRVLPELEALANYFEKEETDFPRRMSMDKAQIVRDTIKRTKASKAKPKLSHL